MRRGAIATAMEKEAGPNAIKLSPTRLSQSDRGTQAHLDILRDFADELQRTQRPEYLLRP